MRMKNVRHFTRQTMRLYACGFLLGLAWSPSGSAVTITGYSSAENDRFSSGFPLDPVDNNGASFVGAPYDWSGVGWSTTTYASSSYKGFGLLSPMHFLTAQHYEYETEMTQGVRIKGSDDVVRNATVSSITNTGYGLRVTSLSGITDYDIAVGTLDTSLSDSSTIFRNGVLDLNPDSNTDSTTPYSGLSLLLYGRSSTTNGSPRIGITTPDLIAAFNGDSKQDAIRTTRDDVQLQGGDSGSPTMHGWTNPNGGSEITLLGLNSAIDTTNGYNYLSFLATAGAMAATNSIMTPEGYALKVVGDPSGSWVGGNGPNAANLSRGQNWNGTFSDQFVEFNADTTSLESITVDANTNLRGLYFIATAVTGDGFTFSGGNILTVGRGGVTNYDADTQVVTADLALGDHQYWKSGGGGVSLQNLNTNGHLLEVAGSGTVSIGGEVSGLGGLAVSGNGRVELSGANTYTGKTWVHDGDLVVNGSIASSNGLTLGAGGVVSGSGTVSALSGSGSVSPGNSPGILTTTTVDPSTGMDFQMEFTSVGSPDYSNSSASINDVLRITDPTSPFLQALDGTNAVSIYLDVDSLNFNDTFRGGFYTDRQEDFLSQISNGDFQYFLQSDVGSLSFNGVNYDPYSGPLSFELSTVFETANFSDGTIDGTVMQFVAVPELSSILFVTISGICLAVVGLVRRR